MSKVDGQSLHRELPTFASEIRALVGEEGVLPPVESWQPERSGEIDIRIDSNGVWFYQGDEMQRQSVVRLLSRILRKDNEDYYLVTPVEKMKISVDDVPFLVGMMDVEGEGETQKIHFSTQTGDYFTLSQAHPLRFVYNERNEPTPYVLVRHKMLAKLSRPVYYQLVDHIGAKDIGAQNEDDQKLGVWSDGEFFSI